VARSVTEIERLDGLVTCRADGTANGGEIECVFLRPAESDVARVLRDTGLVAQIVRARSVTSEWAPEEPQVSRND
jgi:hypothetical protein